VTWFSGLVNKQNGRLDEALRNFEDVVATHFAEARKRQFDFGKDYIALDELGQTLMERAKQERGPQRKAEREGCCCKRPRGSKRPSFWTRRTCRRTTTWP